MSKIKKIISGGLEIVRDSAKQLGQTVSPDALARQALGQQPKNEFSDYLKKLSPDLTPEEMEKKKDEFSTDEQKKLEEARQTIRSAMPDHMRLPPKQGPPGPYETAIQEKKQEKDQQAEAQKKNPPPLFDPETRQTRGMLGKRRKPTSKGFEGLQKDSKVG